MFLSTPSYVIAIIVSVVVLQYAFALFCLLKLAYFDIPRNHYILWNILILVLFFIGGAIFLVYYYKHPDKRIAKQPALPADEGALDTDSVAENKDGIKAPAAQDESEKTEAEKVESDSAKPQGESDGDKK